MTEKQTNRSARAQRLHGSQTDKNVAPKQVYHESHESACLQQRAGRQSADPPLFAKLEKLALWQKVPGQRAQWHARCPAHKDSGRSLLAARQQGGWVIPSCRAGCELEAILAALGAQFRECAPWGDPSAITPDYRGYRVKPQRFKFKNEHGTRVETLLLTEVIDPQGNRLGWDARNAPPVDRANSTSKYLETPLEALPLYRLPQLLKTPANEPVFVCMGAKGLFAVDTLRTHRRCAVGTAPGLNVLPNIEALFPLIRRPVVLWSQHTPAWHAYMAQFARRLKAIGVVNIYWVDWPNPPPSGGADEFFAQYRKREEEAQAILDAYISDLPPATWDLDALASPGKAAPRG